MSQISEHLRKHAAELKVESAEAIAVGMLKQAGLSEEDAKYAVAQEVMEKEAARSLADRGVDVLEATKMVKAAGVDIRKLTTFDVSSFGLEANPTAELLTKTASYIEAVEEEVSILRSKAEKLELEKKAAEERANTLISEDEFLHKRAAEEQLGRLNKSGVFTNDDLEQLKIIDPALLHKVASVMDDLPSMGQGGGMAASSMDPLLSFILS